MISTNTTTLEENSNSQFPLLIAPIVVCACKTYNATTATTNIRVVLVLHLSWDEKTENSETAWLDDHASKKLATGECNGICILIWNGRSELPSFPGNDKRTNVCMHACMHDCNNWATRNGRTLQGWIPFHCIQRLTEIKTKQSQGTTTDSSFLYRLRTLASYGAQERNHKHSLF